MKAADARIRLTTRVFAFADKNAGMLGSGLRKQKLEVFLLTPTKRQELNISHQNCLFDCLNCLTHEFTRTIDTIRITPFKLSPVWPTLMTGRYYQVKTMIFSKILVSKQLF